MQKFTLFIAALLMSFSVAGAELNQRQSSQVVVFVHGAWGGGWDYKNIAAILEERGYEVYRPTLTGLGERKHLNGPDVDLNTHIDDIVNVLIYEDLQDVILVGHSYAGMVITGVADRVPQRIRHLLYMDAVLPIDGESVFGFMGPERSNALKQLATSEGEPWALSPQWENRGKAEPHPIGTYSQPLKLQKETAVKGTYVLTVEPDKSTDQFTPFAERAKLKGWRTYELKTGHNPHHTMPHKIIEIIDSIAESGDVSIGKPAAENL